METFFLEWKNGLLVTSWIYTPQQGIVQMDVAEMTQRNQTVCFAVVTEPGHMASSKEEDATMQHEQEAESDPERDVLQASNILQTVWI